MRPVLAWTVGLRAKWADGRRTNQLDCSSSTQQRKYCSTLRLAVGLRMIHGAETGTDAQLGTEGLPKAAEKRGAATAD